MKKILFFVSFIVALIQVQNLEAKDAAPVLEEVKINKSSGKKSQTLEEINAELIARKEAAEPFDPKDVKVDIESLGLDSIDEKPDSKKPQIPATPPSADVVVRPLEPIKTPVEPDNKKAIAEQKNQPEKITPKKPAPIAMPAKPLPEAPSKLQETEKNSAQVNVDGTINQTQNNKILSKIQDFVKNKTPLLGAKKSQDVDDKNPLETLKDKASDIVDGAETSLKKMRKLKIRQRIAQEKKKAAQARSEKIKKAKEARLNKLRDEYLIKISDDKNEDVAQDEDFKKNAQLVVPEDKSLGWGSRFVSDEAPPAPILERTRGIENRHIPMIENFAERVDDLFYTMSSDDPAYFNAAYQYVLDPNIKNKNGETILTYAALLQRYAVMVSILAKGADPDFPNSLGHTPLDIAIEMTDLRAAQMLIDMNADVNYVDGLGRTYLMHAARVGFLPMVDLLVSQGADVNATDNDGITALTIAYRHKKEIIVKFLLKHDAKTWIQKPYKAEQQNLIKELESRWDTPKYQQQ